MYGNKLIVKIRKYEKKENILPSFGSIRPEVFYKIDVLKHLTFRKIHRKYRCWSLFLKKL